MGGGANKEGKRGETNWVVGGQLGQEGVIWKLGVSIINPPPPKSPLKNHSCSTIRVGRMAPVVRCLRWW